MQAFHRKYGVPLVRKIHQKALGYLKVHNPIPPKLPPAPLPVLAPSARAPVFALHSGTTAQAGGLNHVEPWIPLFREAGFEFIVIARSPDLYHAIRQAHPDVSVCLARKVEDTDTIVRAYPSLRAFFYVSNAINNAHFQRCATARHISLGHGDSDKSSSMTRIFKVYDEIFVAGQAHIDRFEHASFDTSALRFRIVGRPGTPAMPRAAKDSRPTSITYLPTWEGIYAEQQYSSLAMARDVLGTALRSGLPVNAKLHPATGAFDARWKDAERAIGQALDGVSGNRLTFIDRSVKVGELLASGTLYICDVSAVVSDCLSTGAPIFVYMPPDGHVHISSGRMSYGDYAYTFSTPEELSLKLLDVLDGNDPLAPARAEAVEYFISPASAGDRAFEKALRELAGHAPA